MPLSANLVFCVSDDIHSYLWFLAYWARLDEVWSAISSNPSRAKIGAAVGPILGEPSLICWLSRHWYSRFWCSVNDFHLCVFIACFSKRRIKDAIHLSCGGEVDHV